MRRSIDEILAAKEFLPEEVNAYLEAVKRLPCGGYVSLQDLTEEAFPPTEDELIESFEGDYQ